MADEKQDDSSGGGGGGYSASSTTTQTGGNAVTTFGSVSFAAPGGNGQNALWNSLAPNSASAILSNIPMAAWIGLGLGMLALLIFVARR